jgi:exopolyphosphatase/guanosine-5'-triphosphate,3'-diphosphate pyrophosphatase
LIIDIGGGSVEFIIANNSGILWKQSFEIGGQRLMELFMKSDPISTKAVERLDNYLRENLIPLANAMHQYRPEILVGSSGSFDTLNDIHWMKEFNSLPEEEIGFDYPIAAFKEAYELLVYRNRTERMEVSGMVELRVDMIVVAVCLVRFIVETYQIKEMKISNYALKEGLMNRFS